MTDHSREALTAEQVLARISDWHRDANTKEMKEWLDALWHILFKLYARQPPKQAYMIGYEEGVRDTRSALSTGTAAADVEALAHSVCAEAWNESAADGTPYERVLRVLHQALVTATPNDRWQPIHAAQDDKNDVEIDIFPNSNGDVEKMP